MRPDMSPLSAEDKAALREFWRFYEPRRASIAARMLSAASRFPQWSTVLSALQADEVSRQEEEAYDLQRQAVLDDRWEPYRAHLRAQGERYAEAGIGYSAWFDLIRA